MIAKKKSKKAQATSIPRSVKEKVWARQKGRSLFAPYTPITVEECCCHFIPRSKGGLGIEENVFGCVQRPYRNEHLMFDGNELVSPTEAKKYNLSRDEMKTVVRNHLILHYPGWSEENLVYKKYK